MIEKIDKIAYSIRKLRVVSVSALVFTLSMMNEFLGWVMTSKPTELGEAVAVSGIMAALVGLVQFILRFASANESNEK